MNPLLPLTLLPLLLTACASTNFSTSATPATVREEFLRQEMSIWGGTRIHQIGNLEFGFLRYKSDSTFTVDPGEQALRVWYYANRGNANGLFWQTDPVSLKANLKPSGRYQVRGDYGDTAVRFRLVDLDSEAVVASSAEAPVVRRPAPGRQPTAMPTPIHINNKWQTSGTLPPAVIRR